MPESDVTALDRSLANKMPPLDMKDSMAKLFRAGKRPLEIL